MSEDRPSHTSLLSLFCRFCGRVMEESAKLYPKSLMNSLMQRLHSVDLQKEKDEIYPSHFCADCAGKLTRKDDQGLVFMDKVRIYFFHSLFIKTSKVMRADPEMKEVEQLKLSREFPLADFWAHQSSMCQVRKELH